MNSIIENYFKWNHAFAHYFLKKQTTGILPIDQETIEQVAKEYSLIANGSNPVEAYETSILLKPENRKIFFDNYFQGTFNKDDYRKLSKGSIFDFAFLLHDNRNHKKNPVISNYEKKNPGWFDCIILNYVLFVIFSYQGGKYKATDPHGRVKERDQLEHIRSEIAHFLPKDNSAINRIQELFIALSEESTDFEIGSEFTQANVGRIKSQIILRRTQRVELQRILSQYNIQWDELNVPYEYCINNDIRSRTQDEKLKLELVKPENYFYFANQIRHYDRSSYHIDDHQQLNNIKLRLKYDLLNSVFDLNIDTPVSCELIGEKLHIPLSDEKNYGLYPIQLQQAESFDIEAYLNRDYNEVIDGYSFSADTDDLIFEYIVNNNESWLIHKDHPSDGSFCVVFSQKTAEKLHEKIGQAVVKLTDFNPVGNGFFAYQVNQWDESLYRNTIANEFVPIDLLFQLKGGIHSPEAGKTHCFITGGLPFIEGKNTALWTGTVITGRRILAGENSNGDKTYDFFLSENNIAFLEENYACSIHLSVHHNDQRYELGHIMVVQPSKSNSFKKRDLFCFDRWGRSTEDVSSSTRLISDNQVNFEFRTKPKSTHLLMRNEGIRYDVKNFDLIHLLRTFDMAGSGVMTDAHVNKIIDYVALSHDRRIQDAKHRKAIKYALMDLGYITRIYQDASLPKYQSCSPMLIKSEYCFDNTMPAYLLYGCFTRDELQRVIDSKKQIYLKESYDKGTLAFNPSLSILPPFILVGFGNLSANEIADKTGIEVKDFSMSEELIQFCANMFNFERDFELNFASRTDFVNYPEYPCLVNDQGTPWIMTKDLRFRTYQKGNYNYPIPTDLMKLYVQRALKKPVCIITNQSSDSDVYFTSEMGLPFFAKRALCLQNLSLPHSVLCFGIDHCLGEEPLYTKLTHYHCNYSDNNRKTLIEKLSGTNVVDEWKHPMVTVVSDYKKKYNQHNYQLYYAKVTNNWHSIEEKLCLYHNNQAIAVTSRDNKSRGYSVFADKDYFEQKAMFADETKDSSNWQKVKGDSVNQILSKIIENQTFEWDSEEKSIADLSIGSTFCRELESRIKAVGRYDFETKKIVYDTPSEQEAPMDFSKPRKVRIMKITTKTI